MTFFGVIGCAVLLMSTFALNEELENPKHWEFDEIIHYESKLIMNQNATASQADEVALKVDGDKIMESVVKIKSSTDDRMGSLLVLNGTDLVTPTADENFNKLKLGDDDVSISRKMSDLLNVSIGDKVFIHITDSDKWIKAKITKIHADPMSRD